MGEGTTITINNEIDFLGILSDIYADTYESYQKFNDEPVIKVEEKNKWLVAGLTAVVAAAVVGAIAAAAFFTAGAALAVAVVACAAVAGVVAGGVNVIGQRITKGEVDWSEVVIAISCGAVSGAVAATPLGAGGQMAVNGVLGGVQSALIGGGKEDILEGIAIGVFCGWLGGAGFVNGWPKSGYVNRELVWSLFHPFKTLTREGLRAIKTGVIRSSGFNFLYGLGKKYISDKLEDLYEAITE
ncbi:MAG: hypothetical protein NC412_09950 [Roseburia sp.]|nr:hypothetical protein [Roseburia sp.]MCM1278978.1 hypothetical protein [Robinsoniella sp.]